jgi:hypothetical protein
MDKRLLGYALRDMPVYGDATVPVLLRFAIRPVEPLKLELLIIVITYGIMSFAIKFAPPYAASKTVLYRFCVPET